MREKYNGTYILTKKEGMGQETEHNVLEVALLEPGMLLLCREIRYEECFAFVASQYMGGNRRSR